MMGSHSHQDRGDDEIAEFNAKASPAGLWTDKNPQPPWEFRKQ